MRQWWRFRFIGSDGETYYNAAIGESKQECALRAFRELQETFGYELFYFPAKLHATRMRAKEKQWGIQ